MESVHLIGGLQNNQQAISVESVACQNVANFVFWYRNVIPLDIELYMYEASMNHEPLKLTNDVSIAELAKHFERSLN